MSALAFDTLKFSKKLVAAGFTEKQAEALADEQRSLITNELATKRDLKELEVALKRDIAEVKRDMKEMEAGLKHDITDVRREMKEMELRLEQRLTLRLGLMMVVAVGVVAALVKLL